MEQAESLPRFCLNWQHSFECVSSGLRFKCRYISLQLCLGFVGPNSWVALASQALEDECLLLEKKQFERVTHPL